MKNILVLLFLLSLFYSSMVAQEHADRKINSIDFSIGLGHISLSDKVFSPLVYRGSGFLLELKYSNVSTKRKHQIITNFNFPNSLESQLNKQSTNYIDQMNGFLNYQFLHKAKGGKYALNIGGGLSNFFSVRTLNFGDKNIYASETGWDFFSSFEVVGSLNKNFKNKHFFEWKISYPLVAYVIGRMRIPRDFPEEVFQAFLDDDNAKPIGPILKSGEFLGVDKFIDFKSVLNYKFSFHKKWALIMTYRFRLYKYPKYLNIKYGTSQYLLGLNYQF